MATSRIRSDYTPSNTFQLSSKARRSYEQQYADIYFARLSDLKPEAEAVAAEAWSSVTVRGQVPAQIDRVLDVQKGRFCWITGTVFMDYSRKPNVLDDIVKEHWIVAPEERDQFYAESAGADGKPTKGGSGGAPGVSRDMSGVDSVDKIMLEDESGRIQLIGPQSVFDRNMLVTGAIVAVLGSEDESGAFEVADIRTAGIALQRERTGDPQRQDGGKIAIVSGLGITATSPSLRLDLLAEFLTGELYGGDSSSSSSPVDPARITRLIIAGNALGHSSPILSRDEYTARRRRNYDHHPKENGSAKDRGGAGGGGGQGAASADSDPSMPEQSPTDRLDEFLATVAESVPVTLMPGRTDPTGVALPQPPIHPVLLPASRTYMKPTKKHQPDGAAATVAADEVDEYQGRQGIDCVTNPWTGSVDGWTVLAHSGQPIDDMVRYLHGGEHLSRARMAARTLEWRVIAPSAPDTLPCYPFHTTDPFVLTETPHLYVVGNQPRFETMEVAGPDGLTVRIVCVPAYEKTGVVVLVDSATREVEVVTLGCGDGGDDDEGDET